MFGTNHRLDAIGTGIVKLRAFDANWKMLAHGPASGARRQNTSERSAGISLKN